MQSDDKDESRSYDNTTTLHCSQSLLHPDPIFHHLAQGLYLTSIVQTV